MEEHLRAKSLREDTTLMGETIQEQDKIIEYKDGQIADKQSETDLQLKKIKEDKKEFDGLSDKYSDQTKKVRRLETVCWSSILLNAILAIIIVVIK